LARRSLSPKLLDRAGGPELALFQLWDFRESSRILLSMPTGLVRLQQTGHSHFITFTCYRRREHLTSSQSCSAVLHALENTRKRYGLRVFGFVLMPEHVHLLISEPERGTLARALQSPKSASARTARGAPTGKTAEPQSWKRANSGPPVGARAAFWQTRYYDRYMRD